MFPQNDGEVCVCIRCQQKLHEINDFYHMVLRCHALLDQNIEENDFLQELREDEIQNALDLLGSGCELSEFESFSPSLPPLTDENNNNNLKLCNPMKVAKSKKMIRKGNEMYECDICKRNIKSKDALKQHMAMKHLSGRITCKKCHKTLNPSSFYLHEKLQHSSVFVTVVTCPVCKIHLKHTRALGEHLRRIHKVTKPKSVMKFHRICESCGKIFNNKNTFYTHLRIKHKPTPGHEKCEICEKIFERRDVLLKHQKTHETLKKSCDICTRTFYDERKFKRHLQQHESPSFSCDLCPNMYENKFSLKNHVKSHEETVRRECHICNRWLSSQSAVKGHLKRVHKICVTTSKF